MSRPRFFACALLAVLLGVASVFAAPLDELVQASTSFLDSLDSGQRALAVLPFNSDERLNWHYVPKDRAGLPFKKMTDEQRQLALNVLRAALSADGYQKIETIRSLEDVLKAMGDRIVRDTELFYFTFFGEPSLTETWGLRYEGHHVSLHWTISGGAVVSSCPQFLGANPAEVRQGPLTGTRALSAEEDLGRQLVQSLNEEQRALCVLNPEAPPDIVTGAQRQAAIQEDLGIAFTQLNEEQQGLLLSLIQVYANTQRPELAEQRLARVRNAGIDEIKFVWMGGLEKGQKHYYHVQGPAFLIEYDNTQNDANHIHTVWRDFEGDFGLDVLKEHYDAHASAEHPGEHQH
ncbi:MAG: DUF3500 domain-containing protein [Candidatus Hydrogenedentes bacterium]|nr:DUF3500 domain-containing protein [Candidatus Hydrogenedentota bacterium]